MRAKLLSVLAFSLLLGTSPVRAHHSFAAEFDQKSPLTLTGVVTKVELENPHVFFYLDVKGQDGKVTNWAFECGSPNLLYRQGWKRDTVKPGDTLTVNAYRAKDKSNLAGARVITLPDGRTVFGGNPGDGGPGIGGGGSH